MSDWLVALLDATGVSSAALVGHSAGSLVALETAARHPSRVSKLPTEEMPTQTRLSSVGWGTIEWRHKPPPPGVKMMPGHGG